VADGRTPVRARIELRDASGDAIRGATRLEVRGGTLRPLRRDGESLTVEEAAASPRRHDGQGRMGPLDRSRRAAPTARSSPAAGRRSRWRPGRPRSLRDWILVGSRRGRRAMPSRRGTWRRSTPPKRTRSCTPTGASPSTQGRLKGSWLLTLAYDSARPAPARATACSSRSIRRPTSRCTATAPNRAATPPAWRKVYVKIEREQLYALFGDYDTGLAVTELSRYVRKMNGVKAELRTRNLEVSAFGAQTDEVTSATSSRATAPPACTGSRAAGILRNSETVTLLTPRSLPERGRPSRRARSPGSSTTRSTSTGGRSSSASRSEPRPRVHRSRSSCSTRRSGRART